MHRLNSQYLGASIRELASPDTFYIVQSSTVATVEGAKTQQITGFLYLAWYISIGTHTYLNSTNILQSSTYKNLTNVKDFNHRDSFKIDLETYIEFCKEYPEKSEAFVKTHLFNASSKLVTIQSNKILVIGPGSLVKIVSSTGSRTKINATGGKEYPNMSIDFLYFQDTWNSDPKERLQGKYRSYLVEQLIKEIRKVKGTRYIYKIIAKYIHILFKCLIARGTASEKLPFTYQDIRIGPFFAFEAMISRWANRFAQNYGFQKALIEGLIMDLGSILIKLHFYPHQVYCIETKDINRILEYNQVNIGSQHKFIQEFLYSIYEHTYKQNKSYITIGDFDGITNRYSDRLKNLLIQTKKMKLKIPDLFIMSGNRITLSTIASLEHYAGGYLNRTIKTLPINLTELDNSDLSITQKEVARSVIKANKDSVITGPAGTGKTKLLVNILDSYRINNYNIRILAPTGCAISNVKVAAGNRYCVNQISHVIHQYILSNNLQPKGIRTNGMNIIIVDEASMLSLSLFARLTRTAPSNTKFIFIGDSNQLPSIDGDSILNFIYFHKSLNIPVHRLSEIYRSRSNVDLLNLSTKLANIITTRVFKPLIPSDFNNTNVILKDENNIKVMIKEIIAVYNDLKKSARVQLDLEQSQKGVDITNKDYIKQSQFVIDSVCKKQIMVLVPYRESAKSINNELQQTFKARGADFMPTTFGCFFHGDYVRCTVNYSYYVTATPEDKARMKARGERVKSKVQRSLHNGIRGIIVEVGGDYLAVEFSKGNIVKFYQSERRDRPNLYMITLTYAMTIHNSQGSQSGVVFIYLPHANNRTTFTYNGITMDYFMHNQMFYVAVTRAQRTLIVYSKLTTLNTICSKFVPPSRFLKDFNRSAIIPHIPGEDDVGEEDIIYIDKRNAIISGVINTQATIIKNSVVHLGKPLNIEERGQLQFLLSPDMLPTSQDLVIKANQSVTSLELAKIQIESVDDLF